MPPGQQCCKRTKMVLPLRLWTDEENGQNDAPRLAHTLDISPIGASLGGLREPLQSGQVVTLQRGQSRNRFLVVWTKQLDVNEIRAGLKSLEPGKKLWDINLPEEIVAPEQDAADTVSSFEHRDPGPVSPVSNSAASGSQVSERKSTSIQRFRQAAAQHLHPRWASAIAGMIVVAAAAVLIQELNPPTVETSSLQRPDSTIRLAHATPPANNLKSKDAVKVIFAKAAEDAETIPRRASK